MPTIFPSGSPPFNLSPADWKKIGIGAVLSMAGALATYIGVEVLPTLKEHVASDLGLLIYTALAAVAPIALNIARKWLGDTRLVGVLVAAVICLGMPGLSMAQEFTGATAAVIDGTIFTKMFSDPLMTAAILIGVCLFASKILKIDLSALILPLLSSLLKPPSTTPATPSTPTTPTTPTTPSTPATPDVANMIKLVLDMLLKARADGDKDGEEAALKLLDKLRG